MSEEYNNGFVRFGRQYVLARAVIGVKDGYVAGTCELVISGGDLVPCKMTSEEAVEILSAVKAGQ